ncbi:ubiquitin specific protease 9/faf [Culex quinquefasciatus]|uniref:ubiquitinyl hydrolase 1 n=1 Tax=Culex quinquefasciatus TaxID=7176 RepID=B0X483_CULQU|nr:ubiquitin specific protease 9/faf [Culex quinquefasciatus]|eukprot:XP_001864455.1 ubiquitin specific protease 9/faf [Culex quinquefasciatus]
MAPQYVEKLEKILRFLIKEKALTFDDLDAVWRAQAGKHEAIVKNVHDLLAKLAWDFNTEQLDYLFKCFQTCMKTANKKQRERLLELNRRLAEDDKNGVMAQKVLKLFWTLAHSADIPPEVLDQALASHVKILDYSCSQERDAQKTIWLDKCVDELKRGDDWALPALRLIREICTLYETTTSHTQRIHQLLTRQQQIQERLEFLKFLLKDGQLWLCAEQAKQIWQCLTVNAAFPSDREECFRWFGKLMGDEPDLDPGINKDFFENNLLKLDPVVLTESGIKCFERFFKAVNSKEERLKGKQRGYVLDNEDLIGKDYLWRVITDADENIAYKAIDLLKEVSTALSLRLQASLTEFHENFIGRQLEDLEIITHTNETICSFKRSLLKRIKPSTNHMKIDMFNCNGDLIEIVEDHHPLSSYNIRDKTLITVKLTPNGSGLASSPDSSSDTSSGSPPRPCPDLIKSDLEDMLPGVIIAQKTQYIDFILKMYQLGSDLQQDLLRDSCSALLHLLPIDRNTVKKIHTLCNIYDSEVENNATARHPESLFVDPAPARILYNLEALHALLIPALEPRSETTLYFQSCWLHCGGGQFMLGLLTKNNFLPNADVHTKRTAFHCVLKLVKFFLYIMGYVQSQVGDNSQNVHHDADRSHVVVLNQALQAISEGSELTVKSMANKLASNIAEEMLSTGPQSEQCRFFYRSAIQLNIPDSSTIKAIVNVAWAASGDNIQMLGSVFDLSQNISTPKIEDYAVCKEAMEEILNDYLFSASRQYLLLRKKSQNLERNAPPPVCRNPRTISAACDLLVALCQHSVKNTNILVENLLEMFCTNIEPLREWEYLPPVGPRPFHGFCGLKNAGATCYMNSVLQQLYMVPSLRIGILSALGAADDLTEDFSGNLDAHNLPELCPVVRRTESSPIKMVSPERAIYPLLLDSVQG